MVGRISDNRAYLNVKREGIKTRDKILLKILAILFVLLMLVSCATPSFAVDNHSTNNASNQLDDIFPSENITADNTPFLLSLRRLHL